MYISVCTNSLLYESEGTFDEADEVVMASITDECPVVPTPATSPTVPCPITGNSSTAPEGSQKVWSSFTHYAVLLTLKRVYSLSESCVKALLLLFPVLVRIIGAVNFCGLHRLGIFHLPLSIWHSSHAGWYCPLLSQQAPY